MTYSAIRMQARGFVSFPDESIRGLGVSLRHQVGTTDHSLALVFGLSGTTDAASPTDLSGS